MLEIVAIVGLLMFWLSLFQLPVMATRIFTQGGASRLWYLAGVGAFIVVLLGFTNTMRGDSLSSAVEWGLAWAVPVICAILGRRTSVTAVKWPDYLSWGLGLLSFVPANFVLLPTGLLLLARTLIWS